MYGDIPTYEMDYGDTAVVPFLVDADYSQYMINVILYNFRYEEIFSTTMYPDENNQVYLTINAEMSSSMLKRGRYYCRIQAMYNDGYTEDVSTLLAPQECVI